MWEKILIFSDENIIQLKNIPLGRKHAAVCRPNTSSLQRKVFSMLIFKFFFDNIWLEFSWCGDRRHSTSMALHLRGQKSCPRAKDLNLRRRRYFPSEQIYRMKKQRAIGEYNSTFPFLMDKASARYNNFGLLERGILWEGDGKQLCINFERNQNTFQRQQFSFCNSLSLISIGYILPWYSNLLIESYKKIGNA